MSVSDGDDRDGARGDSDETTATDDRPAADRPAADAVSSSAPARAVLLLAVGATLAATFLGAYSLFAPFFPAGDQLPPALLAAGVTAVAGVASGVALAATDAVDATATARRAPVAGGVPVRLVPLGWVATAPAAAAALLLPGTVGPSTRPWVLLGVAVVAGLLGLLGTALLGRRAVGRPWHAALGVVGGLGVLPAASLGAAAAGMTAMAARDVYASLAFGLLSPLSGFALAVGAAALTSLAALADSPREAVSGDVTTGRRRRTALLAGAWLVCGALLAPTLSFLFTWSFARSLTDVALLGLGGLSVLSAVLLLGSVRLGVRGRQRDRALVLCGSGVVVVFGVLASAGLVFVGPFQFPPRLSPSHSMPMAAGAALGALLVPLSVSSAATTVRLDRREATTDRSDAPAEGTPGRAGDGPTEVPRWLRHAAGVWQLLSVPLGVLAFLVLSSDAGSFLAMGPLFTAIVVVVSALTALTAVALADAWGAPGTPAATAPFGVVVALTGAVYLSTLVAPGPLGDPLAGALVILHGLSVLLGALVLLGPETADADDPASDPSGVAGSNRDGTPEAPGTDDGGAATTERPAGVGTSGLSSAADGDPVGSEPLARTAAGAGGTTGPSTDAVDASRASEADGASPGATGVDLPPALSAVADAAGVDAVEGRGEVASLPALSAVVDGQPARLVAAPPDGDADGDAFARAASQWASASGHEAVVTLRAWGTDPTSWLLTGRVAPLSFDDVADRPLDDRLDLAIRCCEAVAHGGLYNGSQPSFDPDRVVTAADGPALDGWGAFAALAPPSPPTAYTAPEQLPGSDGGVGRHTTVYRLGAVAYHLLCGVPPHDDADLPDAILGGVAPPSERGLPAPFDDPLGAALAPDPDARYPSARHLALDLEGARPEA